MPAAATEAQATSRGEHAFAFGPFRLLPRQRLLLEGDKPVRLGSRALDILMALVERARRARPAPLLDARRYRRDLRIRVGACISGVWDQPLDRPALDLVGRPRSLISVSDSRAGARAREDGGSVGAFTRLPTRSRPRSASRY
jgi:hypothetical protein